METRTTSRLSSARWTAKFWESWRRLESGAVVVVATTGADLINSQGLLVKNWYSGGYGGEEGFCLRHKDVWMGFLSS